MPVKRYRVKLTDDERVQLKKWVSTGKSAAYKRMHAQVLLLADEASAAGGHKDQDIVDALQIGTATVCRIRRRFVEHGLQAALERKPQKNRRARKLDGQGEAFLIATACSQAPPGRSAWTLRLLADRLIECEVVETISHEAVRQVLKKTHLNPG
jgi:transposase